jgi:formyltetrahydrofolate-dependent phosphoribosylglycinamide formyltransferase
VGSLDKNSKRIAIAISGSGRTLENLVHQQLNAAGYQVSAVISSSLTCPGFAVARNLSLPLFVADFSHLTSASEGAAILFNWLAEKEISLVVLAGFLKKFPCNEDWNNRIINIHPALLPKYGGQGMYGMNVHRAVLAAGEQETGATVHFVNQNYDSGAIIAQSKVPVNPQDTCETLAARVFASECELYPKIITKLLVDRCHG